MDNIKFLQGVLPDKKKRHGCIFLLDSMKHHCSATVCGHVRKWLNKEWSVLFNSSQHELFDETSYPRYDIKVPQQDNGYDCGAFVCLFQYGMYALRDVAFSFDDFDVALDGSKFRQENVGKALITDSEAFNFDAKDIARFRVEYQLLIKKLSNVFVNADHRRRPAPEPARPSKRRRRNESPTHFKCPVCQMQITVSKTFSWVRTR